MGKFLKCRGGEKGTFQIFLFITDTILQKWNQKFDKC